MEEWRDIEGFDGYQVSNEGRVRTFYKKKHYSTGYGTYRYKSDCPEIMKTSDDGNGYQKLMLYDKNTGKRYCKKVHRLVAEAFIQREEGCNTVDHIISGNEGKRNNNVNNLQWISRRDNIKKAYKDGVCDERIRRQKKPVIMTDIWSGEKRFYKSIDDAAKFNNMDRANISHNLLKGSGVTKDHYIFEYADREDVLLNSRTYDEGYMLEAMYGE